MSNLPNCISSENNENFMKYPRHVLRPKDNILRHKCSKALKRKLRKYKLRRDGKEDQDVLDVSQILLSTLKIKSPNRDKENNNSEIGIPKNYLFKMVRKQNKTKFDAANSPSNIEQNIGNEPEVLPTKRNNSNSIHNGDVTNEWVNNSQDKKHTNAFKLMMESRNKSIGSNSPGKEKSVTETEIQEMIEKKNIKAKRNLVLQQMADAKGALKKKQVEEYKDQVIKIKMEKRAEKLKNMITKKNSKGSNDNKQRQKLKNKSKMLINLPDEKETTKEKRKDVNRKQNVHIIDIFNDAETCNMNEITSKEDHEFLQKLSPSIRKEENMLCYFKKIEKDGQSSSPESVAANVIKVKLTPKSKKKSKKSNLSVNDLEALHNHSDAQITPSNFNKNELHTSQMILSSNNNQCKKRKRKENIEVNLSSNTEINNTSSLEKTDGRPKRNVKKPLKYVDDLQLFSSDEEYHIFTPKKKRHTDKYDNCTQATNFVKDHMNKIDNNRDNHFQGKSEKKAKKTDIQLKKPIKLAPIFGTKPYLDPISVEARQKFLFSEIPEQLKKSICQKGSNITFTSFNKVIHVQQIIERNVEVLDQSIADLLVKNCEAYNHTYVDNDKNMFKKLIHTKHYPSSEKVLKSVMKNTPEMLQYMKQSYPRFPVYRTYRILKSQNKGEFYDYKTRHSDLDNSIEVINDVNDMKNENPDNLNWTDKYKAMSAEQILGNFDNVKELKKWLESWTENVMQAKYKDTVGSGSDFSDADSRDSVKFCNNLFIISGPIGSGKTSSVYAVAADLAIKVIEVNVSSKRTGKIMLQDLQEATQSHKVNRGKGSGTENSQNSQEIVNPDILPEIKRRKRKGKTMEGKNKKTITAKLKLENYGNLTSSQEVARTGMSLILIDDADIVFDQDDGFCSAITQLIQSSKRPVILVTSSLTCPHLRKFIQIGKIVNMNPLSPKMLGTWLDIMCLVDSGQCYPGMGEIFLDYFNGDIRQTINFLQFYMSIGQNFVPNEKTASQKSDDCNILTVDDENPNISWKNCESFEKKHISEVNTNFRDKATHYYESNLDSKMCQSSSSVDLFNVWWNLSNTWTENSHENNSYESDNENMIVKLESIATTLDNISISDYFSHIKPDNKPNITSSPWHCFETDSVSDCENLAVFNNNYKLADNISHYLIPRSIREAQKNYGNKLALHLPSMTQKRERDKIVTCHHELTSYLNPGTMLDRRALALDYWSSCRSICRFEKVKTDNNTKRNNRYCHYLKTLKVMFKNETFDKLAESLCSSEKKS